MAQYLYFSLLLLFSCASSLQEDDCKELNWQQQGSRDSSQGLSRRMFTTYQINCLGTSDHRSQLNLYNSGHQSGLKNYCNYRTGKLLGESGAPINPTCDLSVFPDFLNGFNEGIKVGKKKALQKKGHSSN